MLRHNKLFFPFLIVFLIIVVLCAIAFGTVPVKLSDMYSEINNLFAGQKPGNIREAVFIQLRLPRVVLCSITGAILAVSGVLMQGLFRNPIVEPGLIGTSAGASLGASIIFVMAPQFSPALKELAGPLLMPIAAFLGALVATIAVYSLAKKAKRISIMSLLLVGIAINSICLSGVGFMSYTARDAQARSITFWNLGNFNGATWQQVIIVGVVALIVSDNKRVLPASMILGAAILVLADLVARIVLAPAEVPIGIITSLVGAPVFIILLKRFNLMQHKGGYNA